MSSHLKHDLKPFVILARLFTKGEDKAKIEIDALKGLASYESRQDACDSYVGMVPLEGHKHTLTFLEVYESQEYLLKNHRNSDEAKEAREIVSRADTRIQPVEVKSYSPKGGYLWRDEKPRLPLQDQFVWIAKFKAHPGKRDDFIAASQTHAGNVHRTEDETYSFLILESTDDEDSLVLYERYSSEKYFKEVHQTSESMHEFRENIKPFLKERKAEGYAIVRGFVDKNEPLV